jgi:hypothetical protein
MISVLFSASVFVFAIWIGRNRPGAIVAAFFLLFSLLTRSFDIAYLDNSGPTFAIELDRYVGGGASTPLFVLSVFAFLLPLSYLFRPSAFAATLGTTMPAAPYGPNLNQMALAGCAGYVALLYGQMLLNGPIPLLSGIDRIEYNLVYAGFAHRLVADNGALLAFALGYFIVQARLRGGQYDLRFAAVLLALEFYYGLTGNRFSIFYRDLSFVAIPFAAVAAIEAAGHRLPKLQSVWSRIIASRATLVVALVAVVGAVSMLLYNSFYNVRGYADPSTVVYQRTIVQPVQLYWSQWDRLLARHGEPAPGMWYDTFVNPIDPTRNTSIQALMIAEVGYARAYELLDAGQQYAGGYPEILFGIFGKWLALPMALGIGFVCAWILRWIVILCIRGWFFSAFMATYLYYGYSLLYIGGMLNFVLAGSYYIKLFALICCIAFERNRAQTASDPTLLAV